MENLLEFKLILYYTLISDISEAHAEAEVTFVARRGTENHCRCALDGYDVIWNSMSPALKVEIAPKLRKYEGTSMQDSPVILFYLIKQQLRRSNELGFRELIDNLLAMSPLDVPGQNIVVLDGNFFSIANYLRDWNREPKDIDVIYLRALRQCTERDFCNSINTENQLWRRGQADFTLEAKPCRELRVDAEAICNTLYSGSAGTWGPSVVPAPANFNTERVPGAAEFDLSNVANRRSNNGRSVFAPPRPSENEERLINGELHLYCGNCQFWLAASNATAHKTAGCTGVRQHFPRNVERRRNGGGNGRGRGNQGGTVGRRGARPYGAGRNQLGNQGGENQGSDRQAAQQRGRQHGTQHGTRQGGRGNRGNQGQTRAHSRSMSREPLSRGRNVQTQAHRHTNGSAFNFNFNGSIL
jgi:hypothetical protein